MANWHVIEHTTRTLQQIIKRHVDAMWSGAGVTVKIATPHSFRDLKEVGSATISLFLYRVTECTELRNAPARRHGNEIRRQPLALELYYVITPWGSRANNPGTNDEAATIEEQKLLGLILQALYDHAEVDHAGLFETVAGPAVWGATDSLQVVQEALPMEDLYRVWDSGELKYQLSATYRVRVLGLESSEVRTTSPVTDAEIAIGRIADATT